MFMDWYIQWTKMVILHNLINSFNTIPIKLSENFFFFGRKIGFDILLLNFTWAYQGLIKIKQFEKDDQICRNSINTTLIQNIIKQQLLRCSVILAYR